jgi:hypothetical protein
LGIVFTGLLRRNQVSLKCSLNTYSIFDI